MLEKRKETLTSIFLIGLIIIIFGSMIYFVREQKLNKLAKPLTEDEISQLKIRTYNFDQCYAKDSEELNYMKNVLNGKNEKARFLNHNDEKVIYSYMNKCETIIKNREKEALEKLKDEELINLQKKAL